MQNTLVNRDFERAVKRLATDSTQTVLWPAYSVRI
jgi:hypothetical protein